MTGKEQLLISYTDETHDSPLRKRLAGVTLKVAKRLHEVAPKHATPNRLTGTGVAINLVGQTIATIDKMRGRTKKGTVAALSLEVAGTIPDGLDGSVAQIIEQESPGTRNRRFGGFLDIAADRTEEGVGGLLRGHVAHKRWKKYHDWWDKFGQFAGYGVTLTVSLPTIVKAFKEKQGQQVSETGKSLFEVLGGRLGKIGLCILSNHSPSINGRSSQPVIDTIATSANIYTAFKRATTDNNKPPLSKEQRETASYKLKGMLAFEAIAAVGVGAHWLLTRERKSNLKPNSQVKEDIEELKEQFIVIRPVIVPNHSQVSLKELAETLSSCDENFKGTLLRVKNSPASKIKELYRDVPVEKGKVLVLFFYKYDQVAQIGQAIKDGSGIRSTFRLKNPNGKNVVHEVIRISI